MCQVTWLFSQVFIVSIIPKVKAVDWAAGSPWVAAKPRFAMVMTRTLRPVRAGHSSALTAAQWNNSQIPGFIHVM